jgi:hypothetical protein
VNKAVFSDKLLSLLSHFSKYELNRFRKMVRSPYFNEQEDLIRLFDIIHQVLKKDQPPLEQLDKKNVCAAMWPGQSADETRLRRLASELTQLTLQFIVLEQKEKNEIADLLSLQQYFRQTSLKKHLDGVERQLEDLLSVNANLSAENYLAGSKMQRQLYDTILSAKKADVSIPLATSERYLDIFYVVQKLKFYVEWSTLRALRSTDKGFAEPPGFQNQVAQFQDVPLVVLYSSIIACLNDMDNDAHFHALMDHLATFASVLHAKDLREAYQIAQNYCAFKINRGKPEYYREVFNIYQKMLQLDILLENDVLSEGVYKNIITSGLRADEFEWVEKFIRDYSQYLPAHLRENALTFNLANLYSHQKKHLKVIETLQNVEYSDVMYALSSKVILLRTYYDLGEYLSLDSLIDSFRIYVQRNKLISTNLKTEYNRFLRLLRELSNLDVYDREKTNKLRQKISAATAATPKKWLLEKIEELEAGKRKRK